MERVLLTTTSYQDTPGDHHRLLESAGFEIVRERGPLPESRMLELAGEFDAFLCGDDEITAKVIEKSLPRLRAISKYGIGLDKIDVTKATEKKIPIGFCPGVNHTTVAEHTFGLLLALYRHIVTECNYVQNGEWKRLTGHELAGKKIGIIGLGRIGKEVAKRARAFDMKIVGFDLYWDEEFAAAHGVERSESIDGIFEEADIISLHTNLTDETRNMINASSIKRMKNHVVILNCARGELVDTAAIAEALHKGEVGGYGSDVLDQEPPPAGHPLFSTPNTVLTPHIGSRTHESVGRQATMATRNLIHLLKGEKPLAQGNPF